MDIEEYVRQLHKTYASYGEEVSEELILGTILPCGMQLRHILKK
jgi:hypothetical protein